MGEAKHDKKHIRTLTESEKNVGIILASNLKQNRTRDFLSIKIQIIFPSKNIGLWTCTDAYARHVSGQRWPLLCNRKKLLVKYIS